jgi:uncharacterized protein DUF4013
MLNMAQIQNVLLYPIRDSAARKNFLIACVLMFGNFIIPILPVLALMGYVVRNMRQVIDEKRDPSMPEWDDWNAFLMDGLRIWGFRIIIMLPLLLLLFAAMGVFFVFLVIGISTNDSQTSSSIVVVGSLLFSLAMTFFVIISIPLGIVSVAGSCHVVAKRSISAGFQFQEWWQIFRKNIGAFIVYYLVVMAVSYVLVFALQILIFTIILICIMPILLAVVSAYLILIQDVLFAYAYVEGRDALAQQQVVVSPN